MLRVINQDIVALRNISWSASKVSTIAGKENYLASSVHTFAILALADNNRVEYSKVISAALHNSFANIN